MTRALDRLPVRVEREHPCGVARDRHRQASIAAAKLDHSLAAEIGEPPQCGDVHAFGIDHAAHGLYALTVVPRAPNFWAFRRVSSNLERAYVSTS